MTIDSKGESAGVLHARRPNSVSRRYMFAAGAGAMVSACAATTPAPNTTAASVSTTPAGGTNEEIIRKWYAAWQQTDWEPVEALMADDFAFSSAAGDDHINKSTYKAQCWESQKGHIGRFEIELLSSKGAESFVKYVCWTKAGKQFRNIEYFRFKGDKIEAIECYFGAMAGYPTAADKKG